MHTDVNWNPWHGCRKVSDGCKNCYVYRGDARYGADASVVRKNAEFYLPIRHGRDGAYRIPPGSMIWTCFTSDFLLDQADAWRAEAWRMMRERSDCSFFFITKRIDRFTKCIPNDWGGGYGNVTICCTCENQRMADIRLPIYLSAPIRHKRIICEPLLSHIDLTPYLTDEIEAVAVGGESGETARVCEYDWVADIREQCIKASIPFTFRQTGAKLLKDGRLYRIPRRLQHAQAKKSGLSTAGLYDSIQYDVFDEAKLF